jgi:hypothetical protein
LRPGFDDPAYIDTLNREAGIDVRLYRDTPNIIFSQAIYPADYRHEYVTRKKWTDEQTLYLRDRYQLPGIYKTLSEAAKPWLHMHDRYWETSIGANRHGAGLTLDAAWLEEHPWRVSTLNPASFHAMRNYVLPLRYRDLLGVTKGGFLIGTYGMEEHLTPFARAFRALPARLFSDMPQSTDTVKYRALKDSGKTWFYVVNTDDRPAAFTVKPAGGAVTDLLTGASPAEYADGRLELKLAPYQLRSFYAADKPE